jgi:hypothetical protein
VKSVADFSDVILVFHKPQENEFMHQSSIVISCASFFSIGILCALNEYLCQNDIRCANSALVKSEFYTFFSYILPCLMHLSFIVCFFPFMVCFFHCFSSIRTNLPSFSIPYLCLYFFRSSLIFQGPCLLSSDTVSLGYNFPNVSKESNTFCFKFKG